MKSEIEKLKVQNEQLKQELQDAQDRFNEWVNDTAPQIARVQEQNEKLIELVESCIHNMHYCTQSANKKYGKGIEEKLKEIRGEHD